MRKVSFAEGPAIKEGVFHQFGVGYEDYESGPVPYTTAVIEDNSGKLHNVRVHNVKFLDRKEYEEG